MPTNKFSTTAIRRVLTCAAGGWLLLAAYTAGAQTESVLHSFAASNGIFTPRSSLIADASGNLYGTAAAGGAYASGAVFEVSPPAAEGGSWTEKTLYTFGPPPDAEEPMAGLVMDSKGALYGTTRYGGPTDSSAGAVYKLTPPAVEGGAWTETILHIFTGGDGAYPMSQLVFDKSGHLWGTASGGGSAKGGVVFELTPPATSGGSWTYTTILNFPSKASSAGGCFPMAGLLPGPEGSFYGTAAACGANNGGVAFKLTPPAAGKTQWGEAVLHAFGVLNSLGDGNYPQAGLIAGNGGVLYGTTLKGGLAGYGTVYELAPPTSGGTWTESVVHSFGADGYNPESPVTLGSTGALYGTASSGGANLDGIVYELEPPAVSGEPWTETTLVPFSGANGSSPAAAVLLMKGTLYGTTQLGGAFGFGTVFNLVP